MLVFKENVKGWTSHKSFTPESGVSCSGDYYTFNNGKLYLHHDKNVDRNTFYGNYTDSSIDLLLNDAPSISKNFVAINYEGSQSRVLNYSTTSVVNEFGNAVALSDAEAYKAVKAVFKTVYADDVQKTGISSVDVDEIIEVDRPAEKSYQPGHPKADKDGFIYTAAVNVDEELVEMLEASRQYENNVEMVTTLRGLMMRTINMGK